MTSYDADPWPGPLRRAGPSSLGVVVVQTFTELGHQARHEASERRRAAFVEWVDSHGGDVVRRALVFWC